MKALTAQLRSAETQKLFPNASSFRPVAPPALPPVQPPPKHTIADLINFQGTMMRSSDTKSVPQAKGKRKKGEHGDGDVDEGEQ